VALHVRSRPSPDLRLRCFWSAVTEATPNLPEGLRIHHRLPASDGREAFCVWEGESVQGVRQAVEPAVGSLSRNEYFAVEAKEGANLPAGLAGT
jgi:hypothetical protein